MPCKIGIIGIINKARVAHHTFHNLITLLLTSSLFLVPGVFRSQAFYIKKYTVNDGLPASYIISLYQDSYGFLWIGTFNGLSRFDGKQFVNYGYEAGLPHIIVDAVYEDNQHRLWLGTRNGMAQLKGKHCVIYPVDDGQAINYVFGFKEMKEGNLWVLTNKGVYQFEKDRWKKIKLYPGFENHDCHNIIESDNGLLINYHHHIVLKKTDGSFQLLGTISHDDGHPAFGQLYQRDSSLYLNRVDKYFEINGKESLSLFEEDLHGKNIVNTFKDSHGCFWVHTLKDQLLVSAPGEKQHFSFKMPVQLISYFYEDRDGTVWIAGIDGLYKVRSQIYKNFEQASSPVLAGHCNVARISENQLLISGENDNLFIAEPGGLKNDFNVHQVKQTASHLEIIDSWCRDDKNRTWLVFREATGLFILENNHLRFLPGMIRNNVHPLTGIAYSPYTHKFYVGADTLQTGNEKGFQNFRSANSAEYIVRPTALHFSNGRVLVETRNSGFFIIDDKDNIYSVPKENIISYQLTGGTNFFDESSGKFWMATPYGIRRYHWEKNLPVKDLEITSKDGLPSNGVRSLAFDNFNRIWVATLSGIVIIEIDSSQNNSVTINQIGYEHGITTDYWAEVKLAKDGDGNIWAGLYDQLIRFDPSQIKFVKATPFIAIDNIQLNLKETDWSGWTDSLSGILQIPYQPVLPYNKNSLGISFKGISFSYVSGMEYSYKLDGADTNWSVPTHSEFVSFMGLPPGNYTFQVRAKKSNSGWCKPVVFSFVIKKPYWTTWWFRILLLAGLIGAAYLFYRFRINQLRKVMALRTKISRDLHDEVGSTLSGIGIISEMAKHDLESENSSEVKRSLDKISVNTEEMLGKMSDIIWAINPQNDSFDKIIKRLESYAKSIASSSGVQLHFKTDEEVKQVNLDMQERNNIYLICKEAINNAIKYSGSQQLLFIIEKNNRQVRIAVKDDGKGFNAEQLFDGNGLKNMKARAKEIKANLNIVSGNGGGTAIELSLNIT